MKNLKIGTRLGAAFTLVVLVAMLVAGFGAYRLGQVNDQLQIGRASCRERVLRLV